MKYYVTTSIPYVNGEPHIGHALELVQADVLARAARSRGDDVMFSTGTDEHGGKIAEKAAEAGLTPEVFTNNISARFKELCSELNLTNDSFIRTTDPLHVTGAQAVWQKLSRDIYKSTYEGWYCTGDEAFFTESEVKALGGRCPNHNQPFERIKEENYFFKLSKYTQIIKQRIKAGEFVILPDSRRNEVLALLEDGLADISISRPKEKIAWGIPVPGDASQVIYVWFEALMNYLTVLGYPGGDDFRRFWPPSIQVIGKDIIRFHAAILPAILLGLDLPLARRLYAHGHITADGQKMSKTLGNVVSPEEIIKRFGVDACRYFLLRHIPSYEDGDFSWRRLEESYNTELANELGNAVSRVQSMITRFSNGRVKLSQIPDSFADLEAAIQSCRFDRALDLVWEQVRQLNQYIDETKPWELAKQNQPVALSQLTDDLARRLRLIAKQLYPFLPATSEKITGVFAEETIKPLTNTLFPKE